MKYRRGGGIVNDFISNLKTELHLPGYNFIGPGTRLKERLARGDKGINPLDEAGREHDIAYSRYKDLPARHRADQVLENKAWERVKAKDAKFKEKAAAWLVTNVMKAKRKLGMGVAFRGRVVKPASKGLRKSKTLRQNIKTALVAARQAVKSVGGRKKIHTPRIIPVPKTGGILPLIPLFAGLSALGALTGGSAAVANAVNQSKNARKKLVESERHNKTMEAIALGKKGSGLYLAPYRKGMGLYLKPY
jgi:hypothetical protein